MTDRERGLKAFKSFYQWNRTFYPNTFKLSYDQFLASYGKKTDIYLDGVGGGIRETSLSDSRIEASMRSLALSSKGKMLVNPVKMFDFMMNEATKIDWVDAASFVVVESVKDVGKGAESLGNSLITSMKILNFLLPLAVLIFAYFWLNKKTEGQLTKAGKGLKGLMK